MEANCVLNKKPEYGLIILGNAGAGKSYICNMIIGYERFETDFRREAVTTTAEYHRIHAGPSDLLIYNIPGLIESHQEDIDRNKREIIKAFQQSPISVVMFVWTQVDGRPQPDDIIAFNALKEAYNFSSKSLMFVLNNMPCERPASYEGRFFVLLTETLNPMPISLEDMFFIDTLNSKDTEKFGATRDRLLHFIAQHHENEQKMKADIIVRSNELRVLRQALKKQYLEAEENKQVFELKIKQMTKEYESIRTDREKKYHDMMCKLELTQQQTENVHEVAGVKWNTPHKEKKPDLKEQCQQFWKQIEDEKGIFKKVEKSLKIASSEVHVKYNSKKDNEKKNFKTQCSTSEDDHEGNEKFHRKQINKIQKQISKLCDTDSDSSCLRPVAIGGGLGAVSVGALGAGTGAIAGGGLGAVAGGGLGAVAGGGLGAVAGGGLGAVAGVILGPCAIATGAAGATAGAALGAAAGTALGAAAGTALGAAAGTALGAAAGTVVGAVGGTTVGGVSGAICSLYRFRKK